MNDENSALRLRIAELEQENDRLRQSVAFYREALKAARRFAEDTSLSALARK